MAAPAPARRRSGAWAVELIAELEKGAPTVTAAAAAYAASSAPPSAGAVKIAIDTVASLGPKEDASDAESQAAGKARRDNMVNKAVGAADSTARRTCAGRMSYLAGDVLPAAYRVLEGVVTQATAKARKIKVDNCMWYHLIGIDSESTGTPLPLTFRRADPMTLAETPRSGEKFESVLVSYVGDTQFEDARPRSGRCAELDWATNAHTTDILTMLQKEAVDSDGKDDDDAAGSRTPLKMHFKLCPCTDNGCISAISALSLKLGRRIEYYSLNVRDCETLFTMWGNGARRGESAVMTPVEHSVQKRLANLPEVAAAAAAGAKVHPHLTFDVDGSVTLRGWLCTECSHTV